MRVEFDQEQTFDVEFHAEQNQVTVEQSQDMPVSFDQARPMDVDFVQDATLAPASCLIETENGVFDCSLETELKELKRKLMLLAYRR